MTSNHASILVDYPKSPNIAIFAEYSPLSLDLCKLLIEQKIYVNIFTQYIDKWQDLGLSDKDKMFFSVNLVTDKNPYKFLYGIYVSSDLSFPFNVDCAIENNIVNQLAENVIRKRIAILPFIQKKDTYVLRKGFRKDRLNDKVGLIYSALLVENQFLVKKIPAYISGEGESVTSIVSPQELSKQIIRQLFSLRTITKPIAVKPDIDTAVPEKNSLAGVVVSEVEEFINTPKFTVVFADIPRETSRSITKTKQLEKVEVAQKNNKKTAPLKTGFLQIHQKLIANKTKKSRYHLKPKFMMIVLALLISVFTLPFFALGVSKVQVSRNLKTFTNGVFNDSQQGFQLSRRAAVLGQSITSTLTTLPLLEKVYKPVNRALDNYEHFSAIGESASETMTTVNELFTALFDDSSDTRAITSKLSLQLGTLYREASFLKGDLLSQEGESNIVEILSEHESLGPLVKNAQVMEQLVNQLPIYLGNEKPSTIALILQDERFNTASGGRISGVVIVSMSGGHVTTAQIYEAEDIDSQLKGKLDAPKVIANLRDSSEWRFEDSNWKVDFADASYDIASFIERSLGITVNGVITLSIPISEDTLLTNSHSSQSLLSAFKSGDVMIQAIQSLSQEDRQKLVFQFLSSLNKNNAVAMLPDTSSQKALQVLGWSGGVDISGCETENCYKDFIGIVETNLSDKPINLNKDASLEVKLEEGSVKHVMSFKLNNSTNDHYRGYIRILVPQSSGVGKIQKGESPNLFTPDISSIQNTKEIGLEVNLSANSSESYTFSWENVSQLNFGKPGSFIHNWRKQTGDDTLKVKTSIIKPMRGLLTDENPISYNTKLTDDKEFFVNW